MIIGEVPTAFAKYYRHNRTSVTHERVTRIVGDTETTLCLKKHVTASLTIS